MQVVDVAPIAMAAPADHVGLKPLAQLRRDVEEARAVGRQQPLVAVDCQHIRLSAADVETQRAQALRAVDIQ